MEEALIQLQIWTDDDPAKLSWLITVQNQEEYTNMPPYDQRFRSYDHWKLGVLLDNNSGQIKLYE
jgi:hypothetical protein